MKALENEADFISATQSEPAESIKKEVETKEDVKKVEEVEECDELGVSAPNSAWPSPNPGSSFRAKLQGKTSVDINFPAVFLTSVSASGTSDEEAKKKKNLVIILKHMYCQKNVRFFITGRGISIFYYS
jgi:hypothetical protein